MGNCVEVLDFHGEESFRVKGKFWIDLCDVAL